MTDPIRTITINIIPMEGVLEEASDQEEAGNPEPIEQLKREASSFVNALCKVCGYAADDTPFTIYIREE